MLFSTSGLPVDRKSKEKDLPGVIVVACFFFFQFFLSVLVISGSNVIYLQEIYLT